MALSLTPGTASAQATSQEQAGRSVTLLTGDRVVVDESGQVLSVVPGPGRDGMTFSTSRHDGHTYVIPLDAGPLLAADKLDRRLFDVAKLIEFGYEDAVPLIIGGRAVAAKSGGDWRALSTGDKKVWLDGIRKPSLDRSTAQIGAPAAHQAGYTGAGVKVAVLDTGVDGNHPDLVGRELVQKNFTDSPDNDTIGHGTHVAATIASAGSKYRGVAPDAQILDGKVCGDRNCPESAILEGMRWAAEQGAAVVNLSLGGPDTPEIDPLEEAVNTLSAEYGTLFVISAGNSGGPETVGSPGSADAALTVGAVERNDAIARFSSRGPRVGDGALKPDVTAPGVEIVAAKSGTTEHIAMSGTSMAAPHVAGAAALLKQQHPDWTGSQIKAALTSSAKPNPELRAADQGAGRIDLAKAITQQVTTEPASLSLGTHPWPHHDDQPVTKQLTYRNPTATELTFDLKLDTAAPAGLFTLSAQQVTVPAKGTASVSVTADTRIGSADGLLAGTVLATSGDLAVRTLVGAHRDIEEYDVTFNYVDHNGAPAKSNFGILRGLDVDVSTFIAEPDGSITMRLPKGNYVTDTRISTAGQPLALLAYPNLSVTKDMTVTMDARLAKPVSITVPDQITHSTGQVSYVRKLGDRSVRAGQLGSFRNLTMAHVGPELPADQFSSLIVQDAASATAEATYYRLAWSEAGRLPTGFVRAPQKNELARIETTIGPMPAGRTAVKGASATSVDGIRGGSALYSVPAGKKPVDYVTTESVSWEAIFHQQADEFAPDVHMTGSAESYRPGRTYQERINYGVFSPSISESGLPYLSRTGDEIAADIPMYADEHGGYGWSEVDSARTTLLLEGQKIGETTRAGRGRFSDVPAAQGKFRLETEATRSGVSDLTTVQKAAWTFRSAHVDGSAAKPLPLSVIRFTPKLDDDNSLSSGRTHRVPIVVQQQQGADNGRIRKIEVEASFDDGKTWCAVPVAGGNALVRHPDAGGFVSLRAKATDAKGNTVEQTIIRAYKLKK